MSSVPDHPSHAQPDALPRCPGLYVCDLARDELARSELELRERVASVEADCDVYRELLF
jgi:hypothetical protein